jgi:hypothetical protein
MSPICFGHAKYAGAVPAGNCMVTSKPTEISDVQSEPIAPHRGRGAQEPRQRRSAAWTDRAWAWALAPVAGAVLARSASRVHLAAAGVPVAALAVSVLYIGAAVIAVTPGVALLSVFARRRALSPAIAFGLLLAGSGGAAMATFWAWYASPGFGRLFDVALGGASVLVIAVFGRRGDLRDAGLSVPLLLGLAIGLTFTGLAFIQGGGIAHNVLTALDGTYWQAGDNRIPLRLAEQVAEHGKLSGYLVGDWLASDRPPLQSGFVLAQWPLWTKFGNPAGYQLLSTGLCASWLPALWVVLRSRGFGQWRVLVAVLATTLTGFVLVSDVYVWSKMLAGTFALGALAIVLSLDRADRRPLGWILAVTLATLSVLAHGGTIFALLPLVPFALRRQTRIPLRALAASVVPAAACYVPWMLFQRYVDPPGDRLLKWQIAGVIRIDSRGFLKTLVMQYQALSFHQLLANKWANVEALVASPFVWHTMAPEAAWRTGFLGLARLAELNDLLPATGLLLLGVTALAFKSSRHALAPAAPLAAVCGIGIVAWVILLWGSVDNAITAINHQGAYAVIVLFIALCALAVACLPWPAAALLLVGNAAWFAVSWVPGLGFTPAAPDETRLEMQFSPAMLLVCLAGLVLAAAAIARMRFASGPARPASALLDGPAIPELSQPLPGAAQNFASVHDAPPSLVSSSLPGIP